uniref:Endonuclease/exonuclease/phosphatase domain-containing protein n=1 Tax=Caenorhabditis japonica TaxID=281687 RepID=A0A8R1DHW6_CAEJA
MVTNVYFPPRSSDSPTAEVREDVMEILDMSSEKHIITGDWNAHGIAHKTDERGAMIEDELDASGVHVVLNKDTFTRAASGVLSSPDITISTTDLASCSLWRTCGVINTDHLPVIIDTRAEIPKLVWPKRIMANFNKANWSEFSDLIETKVTCYAGPRDAYALENFLSATITRAASKHIPHGKFTGKFQYSHPLQYRIATHAAPTVGGYTIASQMGIYFEIYGWLFCNYPKFTPTREHMGDTKEISELMKEREVIQRTNPLDSNLRALNDKIDAARWEQRRLRWHEKIEDMEDKRKTDCNALWQVIKGLKPNTKSTGSIRIPNGSTTSNPKTIANAMASSLVAVGKGRDCREERITWRKIKRRLKKLRSQLPSISHAEVKLAILKGKPSKSLGPDGICHLHLKHVSDNCISLAEFFNASIDENMVPDSWKKANMFMLPKPGKDPTEIKTVGNSSLLQDLKRSHRSDLFKNFEKIEKTTASLTRLTNAIVLLKDVNESSKIMKMVLAEALSVHDMSLFDAIDETDVKDIVGICQIYNSITALKTTGIHNLSRIFETTKLRSDTVLPEVTTMLASDKRQKNDTDLLPFTRNTILTFISAMERSFSFNTQEFDFKKLTVEVQDATSSMEQLESQLKSGVDNNTESEFQITINELFWPIFVTAVSMTLSCAFAYGIHVLRNTYEEIKKKDPNATFF